MCQWLFTQAAVTIFLPCNNPRWNNIPLWWPFTDGCYIEIWAPTGMSIVLPDFPLYLCVKITSLNFPVYSTYHALCKQKSGCLILSFSYSFWIKSMGENCIFLRISLVRKLGLLHRFGSAFGNIRSAVFLCLVEAFIATHPDCLYPADALPRFYLLKFSAEEQTVF